MTTTETQGETLIGVDSNGITWYRRADGTCRLEGGPNVPAPAPVTPLGRLSAAVRRLHADGWTYSQGEYRRGRVYAVVETDSHAVTVTAYLGQTDGGLLPPSVQVEWSPDDTTWGDAAALLALIGGLR